MARPVNCGSVIVRARDRSFYTKGCGGPGKVGLYWCKETLQPCL